MIKLAVILLSLIGGLYGIVLNIVQHRSASNPTPANLADVYDDETYAKWKKYEAEHSRFSILSSIVTGIVMLALLATDTYSAVASLFPAGDHAGLLSVIIFATIVSTVFEIVESYVTNMVIEQKYGFNKMTIKTFIADRIRSFLLNLLLSILICYAVFGFYSLVGIKTPGLTCATELGLHLAKLAAVFLGAEENPCFDPHRPAVRRKEEPDFYEIICQCGQVTRGEILEAIRRGATTVDGVKRRVGTGMGRCQGSRCTWEIEKLLEENGHGAI